MDTDDFAIPIEEKPKRKRKPGRPLHWYQVWWLVYRHPSSASFEHILADPSARPARAYLWTSGAAVVMIVAVSIKLALLDGVAISTSVSVMGTAALVVAIFLLLGLIIFAGILNAVAKYFGGQGSFDELVYAAGAILAATWVSIAALDFLNLPDIPLWIAGTAGTVIVLYSLALLVPATKAIYGFSTRRAVATLLTPILLGIFLIVTLSPAFNPPPA